MAIDLELRKRGLGASEIASVLGISPYRTAFDTWLIKRNMVKESAPTAIMKRGHFLERGIVEWFSDATGIQTEWFDQTLISQRYPFMLASPDAWEIQNGARVAEVQAKSVGWPNRDDWGESGDPNGVPDYTAVQCYWTMAVAETDRCYVAALLGIDDLRIYELRRDPEIEEGLIEAGREFWERNVVGGEPPPMGVSELTSQYLKERWPKNEKPLRVATPEEQQLIAEYRESDERYDSAKERRETLANRLRDCIADGDGIISGPVSVTNKLCKDTLDTDWSAAAQELAERLAIWRCGADSPDIPRAIAELKQEMVAKHRVVVKKGSRRLLPNWSRK